MKYIARQLNVSSHSVMRILDAIENAHRKSTYKSYLPEVLHFDEFKATKYSKSIKFGRLISQSIGAGATIYNSEKIELVYSEGKPFIADLDGQNKKQVEEYFFGINKKGAKMKYKFVYEENDDKGIEVGTVLDTSIKNDYADFGELIYVYLKH